MSDNEKKRGPKVKPDPVEKKPEVSVKAYPERALGICLVNGKPIFAKIPFNPLTGESGTIELIQPSNDNLIDAEYDFRDMLDDYIENFYNREEK